MHDIFQKERLKDIKYDGLLNRQIKCTEWFTKQFEDSVKQGDFMNGVIKQVKIDEFTAKLNEKLEKEDLKHLNVKRHKS